MKHYNRVMLGKKSIYAAQCLAGGFIGADNNIGIDLSNKLGDEGRADAGVAYEKDSDESGI